MQPDAPGVGRGSVPAHLAAVLAAVALLPYPPTLCAETVAPEVVLENVFSSAEGLAFNGEGRLFMAADHAVWEVKPDGTVRKLSDFASNLGLAAIGPRDLLFADFGPLVRPQHGPNTDGLVWRLTPEGDKRQVAGGIGDPNSIVVLPNGHLLVSDDFTSHIYEVSEDGAVSVFTDAIPFPNGLALAPDGSTLYVAQIFESAPEGPPPLRFSDFSDRVFRLPLRDERPAGEPEVIFRCGGEAGPDGLALDGRGSLYMSAARAGQLWRFDLATGTGELLAEGLPGLASLAFGQGAFDPRSLYATQIRGGRLLRFRLGTESSTPPPAPPAPPPSCADDPAFGRLDFWLGRWEVFGGDRLVGTNRIEKVLDGCAVTETWTAATGGTGRSLFFVDPTDHRFHQVWVTARALAPGGVKQKRELDPLPEGGVRFQGTVRDGAGGSWLDRTTLTPLPDGTVRQRIEVSTDGGDRWETKFDAIYQRAEGSREENR